jgi:CBS domain-containing protein
MRSGIRAIDIGGRRVITVKEGDSLMSAAKTMAKKRVGGIPVLSNDQLVGIITERDIINRVVAKGKDIQKLKVRDIMTSPIKVCAEKHDDLTHIAKKMVKHDVSRMPIVEDNKLLGFISNKDLARESPALINVLLEQLRVSDPGRSFDPSSFGECDSCGQPGQRDFKSNKFLCEFCLSKD